MSEFAADEISALREIIEMHAIQEVMLRYTRAADRNDFELMQTIFWPEGTDNHGMYSGDAAGFFVRARKNRDLLTARYHIVGPPRVLAWLGSQARVETYFHYVGAFVQDDGDEVLGVCAGRYRDLFEKRAGEWRVLHRVTVYDWSESRPYEPAWQFFGIPPGINRGTVEPSDATYESSW